MLLGYRSLLLGVCSLLLVSGCGSSSYGSSSGSAHPTSGGTGSTGGGPTGNPIGGGGGLTGSNDSVVGTPSVAGTVSVIAGATRTASITFTSSDARAISGFGISGSLGTLPPGWSGPKSFACALVSTGSGCVLNLTYAPVAVASGTLTLDYVFVDNATVPNTGGSLTIAYVATPQNNVVAAASPTGQINAVVGGGSQPVIVNFTTDDGGPATALTLSTDLAALPPGWSSTAKNLSCATVSTGNGCQLNLTYSPTAAGRGTLTLNYAYNDNAGIAKTGSLNVPYAATTNDNVVATASPTGQINAVAGAGSQAVSVTFTTDDGQPATALQLTSSLSALPAGWSSTDTSFMCSSLSSGNGCQLPLKYAPTGAGGGTLTLSYSYLNDAGVAKTGSLTIAYRATTNDNIVGTPSPNPVAVTTGNSAAVNVTFTTDDGNLASNLAVTSGLAALPPGWSSASSSFACSNVSTGTGCHLSLTYAAPAAVGRGTLTLTYSYNDDSGTVKSGSVSIPYTAMSPPHLYIAQFTQLPPLAGALYYCSLMADGTLSSCAPTGNNFTAPTGIVFNGSNFAYVADDNTSNAVYLCNVGLDGTLTGCTPTGSNFHTPWQLAINGNNLYATNVTGGVTVCAIRADGTLSPCTVSPGTGTSGSGIAVSSSYAYIGASVNSVNVCSVGVSGSLSFCTSTGSGFSTVDGISLAGGYAYVANQGNGTVSVCPINPDGTFASCTASNIGGAPTDVLINGSQAYVNDATAGISLCAVDAAGALTSCAPSSIGTSFSYGIQIAIH
jgi:hypothetical protein